MKYIYFLLSYDSLIKLFRGDKLMFCFLLYLLDSDEIKCQAGMVPIIRHGLLLKSKLVYKTLPPGSCLWHQKSKR